MARRKRKRAATSAGKPKVTPEKATPSSLPAKPLEAASDPLLAKAVKAQPTPMGAALDAAEASKQADTKQDVAESSAAKKSVADKPAAAEAANSAAQPTVKRKRRTVQGKASEASIASEATATELPVVKDNAPAVSLDVQESSAEARQASPLVETSPQDVLQRLDALTVLLSQVATPSRDVTGVEPLLDRLTHFASQLEDRDQQLRQREQELVRQSSDLASRRREHAARLRQFRQVDGANDTLAASNHTFQRLLTSFEALMQGSASTSQTEALVGEEIETLRIELQTHQQTIAELSESLQTERQLVRELREQADQRICETLFGDEQAASSDQADAAETEALLREQDSLRNQIAELEDQNRELAAKLTAHSMNKQLSDGNHTATSESMSWEDRKRMILQRLEHEEHQLQQSDPSATEDGLDEIQTLRQMVQRADGEIRRRDEEIAELRQLLEQQSSTVGDVAIGAAAIAGLLDQDDLVRDEREKLQQIQNEWQEKLREAEIEVSLERARLARERQNIEKRNVELEDLMSAQKSSADAIETESAEAGKPKRKWLAKLGLDQ